MTRMRLLFIAACALAASALAYVPAQAATSGAGEIIFRSSFEATLCGNSLMEDGETCDDANTSSNDGCSELCLVEPGFSCAGLPSVCATTCGDGISAGAETCDDNNAFTFYINGSEVASVATTDLTAWISVRRTSGAAPASSSVARTVARSGASRLVPAAAVSVLLVGVPCGMKSSPCV